MSGLFRSMSMHYVAITMTVESSRPTVASIAAAAPPSGLLHLVDVSAQTSQSLGQEDVSAASTHGQHLGDATVAAVAGAPVPAAASPALHSPRYYKRRMVQCVSWLRRLDQIESMRDLCPSLPSLAPGAADPPFVVRDLPVGVGDVLEAAHDTWAPLESELALNARLDTEMRHTLAALIERRIVVDTCKQLDLNEEMAKLQQMKQLAGVQSASQRREEPFLDLERAEAGASQAPSLHICDYVAGTIPVEEQETVRRLLFRMSRGNALVRFSDSPIQLLDPSTRTRRSRTVFFIVFIGQHLRSRIRAMCDIVNAHLYRMPLLGELEEAAVEEERRRRPPRNNSNSSNSHEASRSGEAKELGGEAAAKSPEQSPLLGQSAAEIYANELAHLDRQIEETRAVAKQTVAALTAQLHNVFADSKEVGGDAARHSTLLDWRAALTREQVLCDALQKAAFHRGLVCMEGWLPESQLPALQDAVAEAVKNTGWPQALLEVDPVQRLGDGAAGSSVPPTAFPINKFTSAFQTIVDTYGVPRYKEINPGLFTITTFPFLFGVMYGDIGHGSLLALFAIGLCVFEKRLEARRVRGQLGDIPSMLFAGRYVLLLMSLFAIYCGAVYNDIFSVSTNLWGSGFMTVPGLSQETLAGRPYPFGFEPHWQHRRNELMFYNSFKMKVSVLLGVSHMLLGVFLSLCNHLYFGDHVSALFEFGPRLVLLLSIFGYMDFLIVYKWCIDWSVPGAGEPPNLIQTMIQMFLSPGHVDVELFSGQATVQVILLLLAAVSVPLMMCVKPCWRNHVHKRNMAAAREAQVQDLVPPHDLLPAIDDAPAAAPRDAAGPRQLDDSHAVLGGHSSSVHFPDESAPSLHARLPDDRASSVPLVPTASPPHEDSRMLQLREQRSSSRNIGRGVGSDRRDPIAMRGPHEVELQTLAENGKLAPSISTSAVRLDTPHPTRSHHDHASASNGRASPHTVTDPASASGVALNNSSSSLPAPPDFNLSEELTSSAIHTIEYVLGTVSNTASYLRLWALSLAHHQLALVFWSKMIMQYGVETACVWGVATFAVLLCMDVLECFLHSLRLHWVEFQNKFFAGDGVAFQPITFHHQARN